MAQHIYSRGLPENLNNNNNNTTAPKNDEPQQATLYFHTHHRHSDSKPKGSIIRAADVFKKKTVRDDHRDSILQEEAGVMVHRLQRARRKNMVRRLCRCWSDFPCCCHIPLDVGVQAMAVFELVYGAVIMILIGVFFGLDLFAENNEIASRAEMGNYVSENDHSGTVKRFEGIRKQFPQQDIDRLAQNYSRIAGICYGYHDHVESKCGEMYFLDYLFAANLKKTKDVWEEFLRLALILEMIHILLAGITLVSLCCFVNHRGGKVILIVMWYLQLCPIVLTMYVAIISQSKRLCILEYGIKYFYGQTFIMIGLMWRFALLKPYQLLVTFFLIEEFLSQGFMMDEADKEQYGSEKHQRYFRQFYELEHQKQVLRHSATATMSAPSSNSTSLLATGHEHIFDNLDRSQMQDIQAQVTGRNEDDPLSMRNMEMRETRARGIGQHQLRSLRHT